MDPSDGACGGGSSTCEVGSAAKPSGGRPVVAHVPYGEPFRYDLLRGFLEGRAIEGVEAVRDGCYFRTVRGSDGERFGWVGVADDRQGHRLEVTLSPELAGDAVDILARVERLFDTDCDPDAVEAGLSDFHAQAPEGCHLPGIRVPCSFYGFEMAVRAILGQQITVKAAGTLAGRVAREFGEPEPWADGNAPRQDLGGSCVHRAGEPQPAGDGKRFASSQFDGPPPAKGVREPPRELRTVFPLPSAFCTDDAEDRLGSLGVVGQRAHAICELARLVGSGQLLLAPGADVEAEAALLQSVRGIGPWTVQYLLMRAYDHPDAFPSTDYGVKRGFPGCTPRELEEMSQAWRPWRSYAVMSLWSVPHGEAGK